ncbi:YIEGIA family protein [Metabacillus arenae]|uniref:YIEGIA domain-containing protein n=1 Tax=Metabacillus arenae TaxID=2771434 RepID=A0A926NCE1_9BACI|nr:YIEGIA family protein [Metabacillus arenae]MBD1378626.1 YIEGIA domain-containing protein [Metabacillus arenae]
MNEYVYPIIFGVVVGVATRLFMLKTDYRQYPTYLHGRIIHVALGFIAAGLGAIAIPAIMEEEFTAITFLTLAATQFREVRNMERNTLTQLDGYELVSRGATYIEGIAIAFESRNYIVIFSSLTTTLVYLLVNFWASLIVGVVLIILAMKLMAGGTLKEIVEIEYAELHFEGAGLYVDNIYIMNIGIPEKQEAVLKYGMGFVLKPKTFNARSTIANLGQRQAILHDVSTALGVFRDSGEPSLMPLAKRDLDDGRLGVFVLPQESNKETAIQVIGETPTLENAIRMPTEMNANQKGGVK